MFFLPFLYSSLSFCLCVCTSEEKHVEVGEWERKKERRSGESVGGDVLWVCVCARVVVVVVVVRVG